MKTLQELAREAVAIYGADPPGATQHITGVLQDWAPFSLDEIVNAVNDAIRAITRNKAEVIRLLAELADQAYAKATTTSSDDLQITRSAIRELMIISQRPEIGRISGEDAETLIAQAAMRHRSRNRQA